MIESQLSKCKTQLDGILSSWLKTTPILWEATTFHYFLFLQRLRSKYESLRGTQSKERRRVKFSASLVRGWCPCSEFMIYSNSCSSKKIDAKMFRDLLTTTQRRTNHMLIKSNLICAHSVTDHLHNNHFKTCIYTPDIFLELLSDASNCSLDISARILLLLLLSRFSRVQLCATP